jgi:phosphatidylglycerophosphate synthase
MASRFTVRNIPDSKSTASCAEDNETIVFILAIDQKGLQNIFGMPAVRRLVLLLKQLEFCRIHVIGYTDTFQPVLSDIIPEHCFHPAKKPEMIVGILKDIIIHNHMNFLLLRANHVFDKDTLSRFLEGDNSSGISVMEYSGKDCVERDYLASSTYLPMVLKDLWRPSFDKKFLCSAKITRSAETGVAADLDGSPGRKKQAEKALLNAAAIKTEKSDGFLARHVSRKISRPISRKLAYLPISPNMLTMIGATIGLAGAFCFSIGTYFSQLVGALLFVFCVIFDGVDGEIARLKLAESSFGHKLDIIMDNVVHFCVFSGIALGLYREYSYIGYLYTLLFLLGGFALCGAGVNTYILKPMANGSGQLSRQTRFMALLSNRDFAYIVLLFALIGKLQWFLISAAVGSYIFVILLWLNDTSRKSIRGIEA